MGGKNALILVQIDIASKFIVTLWGVYLIRDIIQKKLLPFNVIFLDIKENIKSGINLMLGSIVGGLILSFSRFLVEKNWNITTFAKLSFTLSISNMIMIFINAIGVVIFPILRKTNSRKLNTVYTNMRAIFVPVSFFILLSFLPIKLLLSKWLPEYADSLFFMGILFPVIVYEGRMSLLISTFLKTLRKEKEILKANVISLCISILLTLMSVFIFNNLILTILSVLISIMIRCIIAELAVSKTIEININQDIIFEILLTLVFVCGNILIKNNYSFIIYFVLFLFYVIINIHKIRESILYLLNLMKKT